MAQHISGIPCSSVKFETIDSFLVDTMLDLGRFGACSQGFLCLSIKEPWHAALQGVHLTIKVVFGNAYRGPAYVGLSYKGFSPMRRLTMCECVMLDPATLRDPIISA